MPCPGRRPASACGFCIALIAFLLTACGGGGVSEAATAPASGNPPLAATAKQSPVGILVPAYFSAGTASSPWQALSRGRLDYPDVAVTAILNPSNGIFATADPNFSSAVADFTSKGGKVVGYVMTGYGKGARSIAQIEANVDAYVANYGNPVSGIFLDEMAVAPQFISFYQTIAAYIRTTYPNLEIIANPGTYPDAGYADVADTLVIFESPASAWNSQQPAADHPWVFQRGNSAQAVLVHDASCADMQRIVPAASAVQYNAGWVYATDLHYDVKTNSGNPWAALPSYWSTLLATVDAINKSQPLPGC